MFVDCLLKKKDEGIVTDVKLAEKILKNVQVNASCFQNILNFHGK